MTLLLDDPGNPDEAARAIAETPVLIEEARTALPALHHVATAKAGERGVRAVIERRFPTYPQPVRTPAEWTAWWADHIDALSDISLASLEAAMRAYVALPDSEFMPKPGKLRELAFSTPCRSLQRYYRAKRAIDFADEPAPVEITPEQAAANAAEVKGLLAGFSQQMAKAAVTKPEMPSIAGKPDEGGLTEEMRKIIARRAVA